MSILFINPRGLTNASEQALCSQFSNGDPANLLNLTASGCSLQPQSHFDAAGCSECSPTSYGCFFPEVNSQGDLNNNFGVINLDGYEAFLFLKPNTDGDFILMMADEISTGFDECSAVMIYEDGKPKYEITSADLPGVNLSVSNDGGILIIGVIDDENNRG